MYITTQISDKEKCFWHTRVLWYNPDNLNLHSVYIYFFTEFYNVSGKSVEAEGCSARQTSTTFINMVSPHAATRQQPPWEEVNNSCGQWGQRHSKYSEVWAKSKIIIQNLQLQQVLYSKKLFFFKILSHWWKSNPGKATVMCFEKLKDRELGCFVLGIFPTQSIHSVLSSIKLQFQSYCMLTKGLIEAQVHLLNSISCPMLNCICCRVESRETNNPSHAKLQEGH